MNCLPFTSCGPQPANNFSLKRTDRFLEGKITVLLLAMKYSRERGSLTSPIFVIAGVIDEHRWVIAQSPTRERSGQARGRVRGVVTAGRRRWPVRDRSRPACDRYC